MRTWARKLTQIHEAYRLERVLDPHGSRLADLLDAASTWLAPIDTWPRTRALIMRIDPGHSVTGSMLRDAMRKVDDDIQAMTEPVYVWRIPPS